MKNITIQIPDMQSAHCQMRVNQAISAVEGAIISSLKAGVAEVSLHDEGRQDAVLSAIKKAGYTVEKPNPKLRDGNGHTLTFKTNINCGSCVAKVTPALDAAEGICHWGVDTTTKDKILSVHSEGITAAEVIEVVKRSGFSIAEIKH